MPAFPGQQACQPLSAAGPVSTPRKRNIPFRLAAPPLPSWQRVRRKIVNPFTGQPREVDGFEFFGVPPLLDVLLPKDAPGLRSQLFSPGSGQTNAYERKPAMVGPTDGPWVWEVPSPLVKRLAELTATEIDEAGLVAALFRAEQRRGSTPTVQTCSKMPFTRRVCGDLCFRP